MLPGYFARLVEILRPRSGEEAPKAATTLRVLPRYNLPEHAYFTQRAAKGGRQQVALGQKPIFAIIARDPST